MIETLKFWKENEKTALLVKGARQVGKTKLIEEFTKTFSNVVEIDFTKNSEALSLLLEVKNYEDFINRLSIISSTKLNNENDVLFLDEIQYYYEVREKRINDDPSFREKNIDIITLSKDIANKGKFRLIMSGSMLGVSVFSVNHNPTGYLKTITMYPMDFEEFLLANNYSQNLIHEVKHYFINKELVPDSLNNILLNKFNEYLFVGGYPAAVQGYVDDKSLNLTTSSLETIDDWYKKDIVKYASKEDRLIILEMYNILPSEIYKKNKKFVKSHLDVPNFKNLNLEDRYLWLSEAGIAIPTYNVSNPVFPLMASKDNKIVKLYMSDTGLLTHTLFEQDAKRKLIVDSSNVDLGSVMENAVAELLTCHGYSTYFQSTKKRGEVDFIIEKNLKIIPIEIKSGKPNDKNGLYEHAALDNLLEAHEEMDEAWLFGICNVKKENDRIQMFPIYMIDFVSKQ